MAPIAELPVLEVLSTVHILSDLTLGLGKVVYDYLAPSAQKSSRSREKVAAS
jgi:acetoacetate decarboxylase